MDDFFKQFKDNLDARPQPGFEEKDWRNLSRHLDRPTEKRWLPVAWWWVALPLLFLLLGANVLFFSELKDARRKISALETQRDTVYLTKTIYQTDTVFQTKIVRQTVVEYLPVGFASGEMRTGTPVPQDGRSRTTTASPNEWAAENEGAATDFSGSKNLESLAAPDFERLHQPGLKPLPARRTTPQSAPLPLPETAEKWSEKLVKTIYAMRPKEFQMGAQGGWALPLLPELQQASGLSVGLHTAVGFSPNLRMWLDADYCKLRYETARMDEALGIPVVMPPNEEYHLSSAEVAAQQTIQFSAGMQYLFNEKGTWQPFIGAGYGAVRVFPYGILYDFEHSDPNVFSSLQDLDVERKETLSGFLLLRAGIERRIAPNWNWKLMATYRTAWQEQRFPASSLLGLQTGVTFGF
ncbi:MAG: hypothetical protein HY842_20220 [Bacteroidetes bacterium]|nr:hypothetical protein [Bacteroidota bacterium]